MNLKIVPVYGASQSGKSTLIDRMMDISFEVDCYHVAQPFKDALRAFWGNCPLNDQTFRDEYKPTGNKTVRQLMKSGFTHFRNWDPDCLLPRLKDRLSDFMTDETTSVLLIDGIRNLNEAQCIEDFVNSAPLGMVDVVPLQIVRVGVCEKDKQMQKAMSEVTEYYDSRNAVTCYNGQNNLEDWNKTAEYVLGEYCGVSTNWIDFVDGQFEAYNEGHLADIR